MTERLAVFMVSSLLGLTATGLGAFVWLLKAQHRMMSNHLRHDLDATKANTKSYDHLASAVDGMKAGQIEITRMFTETLKDVRRDCLGRRDSGPDS